MKNIYSLEGVVDTYQSGKVIHAKWLILHNADAIYDSCGAQMEAVQKEDIQLVIIDMLDAKGTPTMECQKWFGDVLFPGFKKNPNFKGLINVLPASAITKMGANHWKKTATSSENGFDVYETDSFPSAKKLVEELGLKF